MIYSYELEKQLFAGLINNPNSFIDICSFVSERDFYSEDSVLNKTIFTVIKQAIENAEDVDDVIIAQRIQSLGLSFEDNINVADYIRSLGMRKVSESSTVKAAKELKKYTIRREIYESSIDVGRKMKTMAPESSYLDIVNTADKIYNSKINHYEIGADTPENIYEDMESLIEERGNNPIKEFGLMGPHKKVNDIYGSLLRPGNITVIVARSGVGKSLASYEKVITDRGSVRMNELTLNDKVLSKEGEFVKLRGIFPQGKQKSFKITFKDGRQIDCSNDHIWTVWCRLKGKYQWSDMTTSEMIKHQKNIKANSIYIPLVEEINVKLNPSINPYLLGCLIGDGGFEKSSVCITNNDEELVEKLNKIVSSYGCKLSLYKDPNNKCPRYGIKGVEHGKNKVLDLLRKIGMTQSCREKTLPEEVYQWSHDNKINLIQGLLDTDGYASKTGSVQFCSSSLILIKQFQKLIWSIGGICLIKYKKSVDSYICSVRYKNPKDLFSLSRKKVRLSENYQYSNLKLKITSIEEIEDQDSICISIDSPSKLFVTDNFIVTHNTQFCMDYSTKVAAQYDIPVLHFDNGEMSREELMMRQCTALSGVPMHLLENGQWRQCGEAVVEKVRSVWPKVKKMKFFYYNVGGMDVDAMINTLKRFYYSQVGRGNKMIFSFDYIKTTSEKSDKNEWQVVGEMVDKFKKCIQKEMLIDGKPIIPMITSVQSNRSGITNNRNSQNIVDDESIVSLSDRIIQFCSHMFILRKKTTDEIQQEASQFGTHKLINIKARHLGSDLVGALEPVLLGDTLRNNFINLEFKNFAITEKGDLRDVVQFLNGRENLDESEFNGRIPDFNEL
jgi:replicative DNA helicase